MKGKERKGEDRIENDYRQYDTKSWKNVYP